MNYYGTRLSDNISVREPEGYLFCLNVPVARTGYQDYWPEELGLGTGSDLIKVFRPEEEVFSEATMASFEGMPITDDHPEEGVDISIMDSVILAYWICSTTKERRKQKARY